MITHGGRACVEKSHKKLRKIAGATAMLGLGGVAYVFPQLGTALIVTAQAAGVYIEMRQK